jgi:cysteinyl-tRNA synthetase
MNDDLNTPIVLSHLFDVVKIINSANENKHSLSSVDIDELKTLFNDYVINIFGLHSIEKENNTSDMDGLMRLILEIRSKSKANKDWVTADQIRDALNKLNIEIKDTQDGATWDYKK